MKLKESHSLLLPTICINQFHSITRAVRKLKRIRRVHNSMIYLSCQLEGVRGNILFMLGGGYKVLNECTIVEGIRKEEEYPKGKRI
jgi:hypothetical protein